MEIEILQIMPAQQGWVARTKEEEGITVDTPIVMWALTKEGGTATGIVGVIQAGDIGLELDGDLLGFEGYFYIEP